MILLFKDRADGSFSFVSISGEGLVSLASRLSGFVFIPLHQFKNFLKPSAFRVVQAMIVKFDSFKNDVVSLREAVIAEMSLQSDFVREVSLADYLKFYRGVK